MAEALREKFRLSTDYYQFYLLDEGRKSRVPEDYGSQDIDAQRLFVKPHLLVVMTFQGGWIQVELEVAEREPDLDPAAWDHVVEASLELPTGRLTVDTCMCGVARRLQVDKGWYRVRVCTGGIGDWESVPASAEIPECYHISLWPAPAGPVRVVKRWTGPVSA